MKLHSINTDARLYVMAAGRGFACYGFDVLGRKARGVGAWLAERTNNPHAADAARTWLALIDGEPVGTAGHFELCANILERADIHCSVFGDRCPADLVPALVGLEGKRVSALYFGERIRFRVGKSMGWLPCHLRLRNARSTGGDALLGEHLSEIRVID